MSRLVKTPRRPPRDLTVALRAAEQAIARALEIAERGTVRRERKITKAHVGRKTRKEV